MAIDLTYDPLNDDPDVQKLNELEQGLQTEAPPQPVEGGEQQASPEPQAQQPEQPQAQEQPQQQQAQQPQQQQQQKEDEFNLGAAAAAIPLGVADTAFDFAGVLGFKKADDWWDDTSPRNTNPWVKATRDLAAVAIPTIVLEGIFKNKAQALTKGLNLSKRTRILGNVASELGIGASVASVASAANLDATENIGNQAEKVFGINVPWAIRDGDSPDTIWAKNLAEDTGIGGLFSLVAGLFAFRKAGAVVKSGTDEVVESAAKTASPKTGDEVVDAISVANETKRANEIDRGVRELQEDPLGTKGYSPTINNIAEDTARPTTSQIPDPLQAKVDNFRINNDIGTSSGTASKVVSEGFQKAQQFSSDPGFVTENYIDLFTKQAEDVDLIFNGKRYRSGDINADANAMVDRTLKSDISFDEYKASFEQYKNASLDGVKFLTPGTQKSANTAFNTMLQIMDPRARKGATMAIQQGADEVASLGRAIDIIGEFADTTEQQKLLWQKLEYLATETNFYRKISSEMLRANNMLEGQNVARSATSIAEALGDVKAFRKASVEESKKFVETLAEVSRKNPEYFKPFYEVMKSTRGQADTLAKMREYIKNRTGFWKKAFVDGNSEVPSYLVEALQSIKYGNVLMVRAPIAAAVGNTTLLGLKPLNALAGSLVEGNTKEVLWSFGGIQENFARGFKAFRNEWQLVTSDPVAAATRQRKDIASVNKKLAEFEAMEQFYEAEIAAGRTAGAMQWNLTKVLTNISNTNLMRFGANAMTSLDAFTKSFIASGEARAKAYRSLYKQMDQLSPEDFQKAFDAKQQSIYNSMFDDTGMLIDDGASLRAKEITYQMDSGAVDVMDNITKKVPALKAFFMFPRTGVNALGMAWSYAPGASFMTGIGRATKALRAKTPDEIADVLKAHGVNTTDASVDAMGAFKAIKSEYIGRQMTGAAVIMSAAMWAMNDNLTGSGPRDRALRQRMEKYQDWQPFSIRNPITKEWVSYENLEPFTSILALTADIVFESTRLDQSITEDFYRKLQYSITTNVSNKTFLSGLEPLVGILNGDEGHWNRFFARELDSIVPFTSARGVLGDIISPQVLDVQNDFASYFAARNRFITGPMGMLSPEISVYDGKEIKQWSFWNRAVNPFTPIFKANAEGSEQQKWVTSIGWEGLSTPRMNPISDAELTPKQRQWINNWIGENMPFNKAVDRIRSLDNIRVLEQEIQTISDTRNARNFEKKEFNIRKSRLHELLDEELEKRFKAAWNAMKLQNPDMYNAGALRAPVGDRINQGNIKQAAEYLDAAKQLK